MHKILIVDDDRQLREQIAWSLKRDYAVSQAGDRTEALAAVVKENPDLILLDLHLPPKRGTREGMSVLREVRNRGLDALVIVMTGDATKDAALRAIEAGAYDFFRKPIDLSVLKLIVLRALEKQRIERENRQLRDQLMERESFQTIVGRSEGMRRVFDSIRRVAAGDTTVIIRGESGTGKELVARAIHDTSGRKGPFVAVQCSALPEHLIESELFGHEKGAFTGAINARAGRFETADGGTLFLDEIGTQSLAIQAKLLRVLEEKEFERLGGKQSLRVDVRLITATNEDLEAQIRKGEFREDLYYRINVFPIYIPPLRERREDIPLLVNHSLEAFCRTRGEAVKNFSEEAMGRLVNHDWRGNVRELQNVIQTLILRSDGETITAADLPSQLLELSTEEVRRFAHASETAIDLPAAVERFELQMLQLALTRAGGVKIEAARLLGIDKNRMMYLCRKHSL
jgi:two-component system response regulator PilR (NtrC family)